MSHALERSRLAAALFLSSVVACGEAETPGTSGNSGGGGSSGIGGSSGGSGTGGVDASSGGAGSGGEAATGGNVSDAGDAGDGSAFDCVSTGSTMKMIAIPAGDFVMGCNAAVDSDCSEDEKPMHTVTLSAFEIDETEVTQDHYAACVKAGACDPPSCTWDCSKHDYAAGCLDWSRAKMYCAFAQKRLPTEAEWEKAARGSDGRKYPWGSAEPTCAQANMSGCGEKAKPVGSAPSGASPYGVLDLAGNMVEMVADWYDANYYASAPKVDPKGPLKGTRYVGRGGGFKSTAVWMRASSRDWYDTYDVGERLGFRCAR